MKTKIFKAFTLIELLIVIVIIGILATALIPRIQGVQTKARYTRVEADFKLLREAIFMAQSNTNKALKDITEGGHTAFPCTVGSPSYLYLPDLRTIPANHSCRTDLRTSLNKIALAAGMASGSLSSLEKDPWGSPYLIDENELEFGTGDCRDDYIGSAGPDGYVGDDRDLYDNTGDNRLLKITHTWCSGSY